MNAVARLRYLLTANLTVLALAWCAAQATNDPALTTEILLPGGLLATLLTPTLIAPARHDD